MERATKKSTKSAYNNIYSLGLINKIISIPVIYIGENLKSILLKYISEQYEGKCIVEGYIKKNSIDIISYSSGTCKGDKIEFNVIFKCFICNPVEGKIISCIAKHITKAGIRAVLKDEDNPLTIFISRDHNNATQYFNSIDIENEIQIKVIGQRYELNDNNISIIAELIEPKIKPTIMFNNSNKSITKSSTKPRITIKK